MIFNHKVKHNGVTYPAGVDVPVGNEPVVKETEKVVETPTVENKTPKAKISSRRTKK